MMGSDQDRGPWTRIYLSHCRCFRSSQFYISLINILRAIRHPFFYTRKGFKLLFKNPRKLGRFLFGRSHLGFYTLENPSLAIMQYKKWREINERRGMSHHKKQANALSFRPKVSILTPVFNPPQKVLAELIESVLAQTYTDFELCLGDFSQNTGLREFIESYAAKDCRIKANFYDFNEGISKNSNRILEKVTGQYVALLDHDDLIERDALFELVQAANSRRDAVLIFSDKDLVDESGSRYNPLFKPDWSDELMLVANYVTHLNLICTETLRNIGGWDPNTDGAQDWDLFLRLRLTGKPIVHVARILYHWRAIETSFAYSINAKPYAFKSQRYAVNKYLATLKLSAEAYHDENLHMAIRWNTDAIPRKLIVISRTKSLLKRRIREIIRHKLTLKFEVILFDREDSGFTPPLAFETHKYQMDQLAAVLNAYLRTFNETVVILDDATKITGDFLFGIRQLNGWLSKTDLIASAPRLLDQKGKLVGSGRVIDGGQIKNCYFRPELNYGFFGLDSWVRNYISLLPKLLVLDCKKFNELGGFDKLPDDEVFDNFFLRAAMRGYFCVCDPTVTMIDEVAQQTKTTHSQKLTQQIATLGDDIFFNRNLTIKDGQPMLKLD